MSGGSKIYLDTGNMTPAFAVDRVELLAAVTLGIIGSGCVAGHRHRCLRKPATEKRDSE